MTRNKIWMNLSDLPLTAAFTSQETLLLDKFTH